MDFKTLSKIYLIDFGLSTEYSGPNGHVALQQIEKFAGNLKFASVNQSKGYSKSRRDDFEGLFYIYLYLMDKKLPWDEIYLPGKINTVPI